MLLPKIRIHIWRVHKVPRKLKYALVVTTLIIFLSAFIYVKFVFAATKCWDGGGTTNNWSELANWAGDSLPGAGDVATFHGGSCTAGTPDKSVTIDSAVSLTSAGGGISIGSNYSGTITQSASVTLNSGGFTQAGGTWNGGSQTLNIDDGSFSVTGGTHTATTGTWTVEKNFTSSGGTLTMTGATVVIDGSQLGDDSTVTCTGSLGGTVNAAKTGGGDFTLASGCTITVGSIDGWINFTINGTMNHTGTTFSTEGSFTINSTGIVTYSGTNVSVELNFTQNGTWDLTGKTLTINGVDATDASTVTCTGSLGGTVNVAKTGGGDFTLASGCTITVGSINGWIDFTINGTMNHTGTTFSTEGSFTINSTGIVTYSGTNVSVELNFTQNGTWDLTGKTLTFDGVNATDDTTLTCGTSSGFNLVINKTNAGGTTTLGGNCTVNNFTRTNGPVANPGSAYILTVQGNFSMSTTDTFGGANLTLTMGGSASTQTITQNDAGTMNGVFKVDKSAGTASLSTNFTTGTTCNVVEGTFDINGLTFTCGSTFTVEDGGTLELFGNEAFTVPTFNTGSTIKYTGDGDAAADTYAVNDSFYHLTSSMTDSGDTLTGADLLTTNQHAYWKMDDASGPTVTDDSGNGRNAIATGTTVVAGLIGNARDLNGTTSNYISLASPSLPTGDFTYSTWVNLDANTDETVIMSPDSGGNNELLIYIGSTSVVEVRLNNATLITGSTTIPNTTWTHIAVRRSGSVVQLFINGVLDGSGSDGTTLDFSTCPIYLGVDIDAPTCSSGLSNALDGRIDETRIYSRALNQVEIDAIYEQSTTSSPNPLDVNGNFTLSNGTFVSTPNSFTIGGNFTKTGGTFTHNSGTVVFDDASQTSAISGSTTFNNLTSTTAGKKITVADGTTQTVSNNFTLTGSAGNRISLKGVSGSSQWNLTATTPTVSYVDARDSNACGGTSVSAVNSLDLGNNSCWSFSQSPPNAVNIQRGVNIRRGTTIQRN